MNVLCQIMGDKKYSDMLIDSILYSAVQNHKKVLSVRNNLDLQMGYLFQQLSIIYSLAGIKYCHPAYTVLIQ